MNSPGISAVLVASFCCRKTMSTPAVPMTTTSPRTVIILARMSIRVVKSEYISVLSITKIANPPNGPAKARATTAGTGGVLEVPRIQEQHWLRDKNRGNTVPKSRAFSDFYRRQARNNVQSSTPPEIPLPQRPGLDANTSRLSAQEAGISWEDLSSGVEESARWQGPSAVNPQPDAQAGTGGAEGPQPWPFVRFGRRGCAARVEPSMSMKSRVRVPVDSLGITPRNSHIEQDNPVSRMETTCRFTPGPGARWEPPCDP